MRPATSIFNVGPNTRHRVPGRRLCKAKRILPPMISCAGVPPVIAAGSNPSTSQRSSCLSSQARNSARLIGLRTATLISLSIPHPPPIVPGSSAVQTPPSNHEDPMAKTYWIGTYRAITNPHKVAAYAQLAGPAITAGGGTFIVRGMPAKTYEAGLNQRTVVIVFDSLEQAIATHDSPAYQAALEALGDGAERDIRLVEGA